MSTKAIRRALTLAREDMIEPTAGNRQAWDVITEALADVEAIEKAARVISDDATVHAIERKDEDAVEEAEGLLLAISEAMPKT